MRYALAGMVMVLALAMYLTAATVPARKLPPAAPPLPDLAGETNWGTVEQRGREFTISGDPVWSAAGKIRKDGRVEIVWIEQPGGFIASALYEVRLTDEGGLLEGVWGYGATFTATGEIAGADEEDEIFRLPP